MKTKKRKKQPRNKSGRFTSSKPEMVFPEGTFAKLPHVADTNGRLVEHTEAIQRMINLVGENNPQPSLWQRFKAWWKG